MIADIRQLLEATPFEPFVIVSSSGTSATRWPREAEQEISAPAAQSWRVVSSAETWKNER